MVSADILTMIELHLVLKAPPNKTRTLIAALQTLAKSARVDPGCMAVEVYKTVAMPRYICYDEIWESEATLRCMIASRHFSQLAVLMELSSEPPVCEFRFITQTYGLGFAEEVRGCDND
jgi:quinol monooxygenase YgiN